MFFKKFQLKNVGVIFAVGLIFFQGPAYGVSWEDEKRTWEEYARSPLYRDPGYAARLAFSPFPIDLGHFYTGSIKKGVWTTVGEIVSTAAAVGGILDANGRSKRGEAEVWTTRNIVLAGAGLFGFLGFKVWSSFDAAKEAERFNARHGGKEPLQQSRALGIGLSFTF